MIPASSSRLGRRSFGPSGVFILLLIASSFATGCGAGAMSPAMAAMPGAPAQTEAARDATASPAGAAGESAAAMPAPGMQAAALPAPGTQAPKVAQAGPAAPTAQHATQAKEDPNAPKLDAAAKPLLVYEGALGVRVPKSDIAESIEKAIDVAEAHGGYLVSRGDTGAQLRVPSRSFRVALKELGALGEVSRRSVSAQDVSEQYHDLEVRLKNLESVRTRLEQFLARAANVDEALRVGKELEAVVRQIDEAKGRMQYLKTRASYSLITLALEAAPEKAPVVARDDKPSTPPARPLRMPVKWLKTVGLDGLLRLE